MNKITLCLLFFSCFGNAQNIQFSDPDLLFYLTTKLCVDANGDGVLDSDADFNNDGQIQMSEAQQVTHFSFTSVAHDIQSLGGFEHFSNLQYIDVTTIQVPHLDFSTWPLLQTIKLSSFIESFTFNNPLLKRFELQNAAFSDPLFDLTNLPNLEYVWIQSPHLTDNVIFGTHNNLVELSIGGGTYSSLNLSGMPALKRLSLSSYTGSSIDISNCPLLEEFSFGYTPNLTEVVGATTSALLRKIEFNLIDVASGNASSLNLSFNNQPLNDITIRGGNSFSISNNTALIGDAEIRYINESVSISNSDFAYIDSYLNGHLQIASCDASQLNLSNISGLEFFTAGTFPNITDLDLSTVETNYINLSDFNLSTLNLKNGHQIETFITYNTDVQFVCVDREEQTVVENGFINNETLPVIHPYCSFVLGGDYQEITGNILVNLGNGCQEYAQGPVFDLQFSVSDGSASDLFYAGTENNYSYSLPEGNHTLSAQLVGSAFWTVTPETVNFNFPADGSTVTQDFCITPAGAFNDLEIIIVPVNDAQPGFQSNYKIIYKNKGTTALNGNISFNFNDNVMDFTGAVPSVSSQTTGNLTWNYSNLLPFEVREISFSMLLNVPTNPTFPLSSGDVLVYSATINLSGTDETPYDNEFSLNQNVVNSFDPNDVTCLEGNAIALQQVGEYVHYRIRFENNGTANAVNVVVKDKLASSKFDISTLMPLHASHDFHTRIVNGDEVEFIFENIQLPFDDATNDGFIIFKVKTKPTLIAGDSFSNQASIYFDFNFPIVTNEETTIINENLSVAAFEKRPFSIFPNPTKNNLTVNSSVAISVISVYDLNGRLLERIVPDLNSLSYVIDANRLSKGVYLVEVQTEGTKQALKFIKN